MTPPNCREECLFIEALGLAVSKRAAFLDRECVDDPSLRRRLESLIAAHEDPDPLLPSGAEVRSSWMERHDVADKAGSIGPSSRPERPNLPCCMGDYTLLEEVARGGAGVIYRAFQESLQRIVAVKTLLLGRFASMESIKRFQIEGSAAAALCHPNIVGIHDVGTHEGECFLVMDYLDGPNLAQLLKSKPLTPSVVARYMRTIAEAIHYAHSIGILHRDLKPSNVLVDANDQPRITDFGLAKRFLADSKSNEEPIDLTLTGQVMGSPAYMAPEQTSNARGTASVRTDVYALGATLYHLLTGRPPFEGESMMEILYHVRTVEPVPPRLLNRSVPLDLETICLKCMAKNPADRYASALAVANELSRFENREPIEAGPASVTIFHELKWTDDAFVRRYREAADYVLPDRRRLFQVLRSFFRCHVAGRRDARVCDLGCGDGVLAAELLAVDPTIHLTLVDGSEEAVASARQRLGEREPTFYRVATFDSILRRKICLGTFDFIASSFAIHHIHDCEKAELFRCLMDNLQPGGWFLNIDVTLPDQEALTPWWIELWREQILEAERQGSPRRSYRSIPEESWNNPDNKYATLGSQLTALRTAGFIEVDCHYRNGIFGIYSGRKPSLQADIEASKPEADGTFAASAPEPKATARC